MPDPTSMIPDGAKTSARDAPVPDISTCFNRSLRRASNRVLRVYDRYLGDCGLRAAEFAILAHIERVGRASIVELADGLAMQRATFRYRLAPLERARFVDSRSDPMDGRGRWFVLTDAGKAKLAEGWTCWGRAQSLFETTLGPDAEALRTLTDAISAVAADAIRPAGGRLTLR